MYTHAPKADAARFSVNITVLLEVLSRDIVAKRKAAIEAERIIIADHTFSEGNIRGVIPYLQNTPLRKIPKYFRLHLFFHPVDIATVAVPQEITGMNVTVPRYKDTAFLDKVASA